MNSQKARLFLLYLVRMNEWMLFFLFLQAFPLSSLRDLGRLPVP